MATHEYNVEYYAKNRKKLLAQKQEYQRANKEAVNKKNRKHYHTSDGVRDARMEQMRKYKRNWRLQLVYGITDEQYDAMLEKQKHCCAICGSKNWDSRNNVPHIDHDHITGKVRGILCMGCNSALGMMKDSPERLIKAAKYLKKYGKISDDVGTSRFRQND